jgi:nitrile hydratase
MSTDTRIATRFQAGDRVKVVSRPALGHCRTPWYLRGHVGVVASLHGAYHDPERLAYHKPGLPLMTLYKVRFRQADLWPDYHGAIAGGQPGTSGIDDHLEADIYEHWLERAP